MTYEESLAALSALPNKTWKLGLQRMQEFVRRARLEDAIGGPPGPQFIHVAGTNGKGSVTAFVQSILVEAGHPTGAFFSPYVVDPRERVQLGRDLISQEEFASWVAELLPIGQGMADSPYDAVSEFEMKTALGFLAWKRHQCRWVALEVGLGGRLDATNVVSSAACAIVSIGLDHCHILGDTHALIATEKAGILKPGVPCVVGRMSGEALAAIERVADQVGAPLLRLDREVVLHEESDGTWVKTPKSTAFLRPSFYGPIQRHNAAVAYAAVEASGAVLDPAILARGIATAYAPGRFQVIERPTTTFVLDGAHNADAGRVLSASLDAYLGSKPISAVIGMVGGHESEPFFESLRRHLSHVYVAPIDFPRAVPVEELHARLTEMGIAATPCASLEESLGRAQDEQSHVLVTGSFYLVGEAVRLLS